MNRLSKRSIAAIAIAASVTVIAIALSLFFTSTPGAYRLQVGHAFLVMFYGTALACFLPRGKRIKCAVSLSVLASIQVAWIAVALSLVSTLSYSGPDTNVLSGGLFVSGIVLAIPLMNAVRKPWPLLPMGVGGATGAAIALAGMTATSSGSRVALAVVPLHVALAWTLCLIVIRLTTRHRPGHCSECGYCLAGLVDPICPECGTPIPPQNPEAAP